MKDNKFFELFNDIDSKFIHEAQEKNYEESTAEAVTPQPAPKRKIYPTVLKTAACLAAVGIAAGGLITLGHGTPNILSPNGSGQFAPEASEPTDETSPDNEDITDGSSSDTSEISDTPETSADTADTPQSSDISETVPAAETTDPAPNEYENENGEDYEAEIEREEAVRKQAVNEWNSREFVSPIGDLPLPEGYSANVDWDNAGFKSLFIPAENPQTEIRAVSDGEIAYVGAIVYNIGYFDPHNSVPTAGHMVLIKHNDYVYTGYCAIVENKELKAGDKVTAGQVIGHIDEGVVYAILDSETSLDENIKLDDLNLNYRHGFTFEVRTAPLYENEIDIDAIMKNFIGNESEEGGEAEVGDHETDYVFMEKDGATVTDSGEFIGTVTGAEQINEPYEDDFKV